MERAIAMRCAGVCVALVAAVALLSGCSGSGSPTTTSTSAGGRGSSTTAGSPAKPGSSRTPSASTTGARGSGTDPRAVLPVVSPAAVGRITYGAATSSDRKHFTPAGKASGGLVVSSAIHDLLVSGKHVGAVAVYRVKPGAAKSAQFQDQYVVQLINAVAGRATRPKFVRANQQVMALSTGRVAVAGWVEGDEVVLVYREGPEPELLALANAVRTTSAGR